MMNRLLAFVLAFSVSLVVPPAIAQKRIDHDDHAAIAATQGRAYRDAGELIVKKLDGTIEVFIDEDECYPEGIHANPCVGFYLHRYDYRCKAFIVKSVKWEWIDFFYIDEEGGSPVYISSDLHFSENCEYAIVAQNYDCCGDSRIQVFRRNSFTISSEFLYEPSPESEYAAYSFKSWESDGEATLTFSMRVNGDWQELPGKVVRESLSPPKWRLYSPLTGCQ